MRTGYPRFVIHRSIIALAERVVDRFGDHTSTSSSLPDTCSDGEVSRLRTKLMAMLFPDRCSASQCKSFLSLHALDYPASSIHTITLASEALQHQNPERTRIVEWSKAELHTVLYPRELFPLAMSFWQHTGFGIPSRYAIFCLDQFGRLDIQEQAHNFNRTEVQGWSLASVAHQSGPEEAKTVREVGPRTSVQDAQNCNRVLCQRIADFATSDWHVDVTDVYLFSSGMRAISNIVQALQGITGFGDSTKMVAYGLVAPKPAMTFVRGCKWPRLLDALSHASLSSDHINPIPSPRTQLT